MMREHLLLQKAFKFEKPKEELAPRDCEYNIRIGAWRKKNTEELLADTPGMKGLSTKKSDVETGEDLKSE